MTRFAKIGLVIALAWILFSAAGSEARPLRWARSGDALTLDPHALNEGPTLNLQSQIYEALVERDHTGRLIPALAVSWGMLPDNPRIWEFKLRDTVRFHNGAEFTADDVVFSLERARHPNSGLKSQLASIARVAKVNNSTVHIETSAPNPLLVNSLSNVFVLDSDWAQATKSATPQDLKNKADNQAAHDANGTGPFRLVSREPDVRTVMVRNEGYWGQGPEVPLEISELIYIPLRSDATRVAALLSGEVDFVQDVPVQDLDHLKTRPTLRITQGLENRTIFFGLDVGSADLKSDDIVGKNPLADRRVREAMNTAIDREVLRRTIMRGHALPAGVIMPPFVNGWTPELDRVPRPDLNQAQTLLRDAGYGSGFRITLHCPNDRYVADSSLCQAVAGMLGDIGIRVSLISQSKAQHFPLIIKEPPETEFYLLGVGVPTYDSQYIFDDVLHTRTSSRGTWNGSRYSNPEIDRKIESLAGEVDTSRRNQTIAEIWKVVQNEVLFLPLHHQMIGYAMKPWIDIPVDVGNSPKLKRAKLQVH